MTKSFSELSAENTPTDDKLLNEGEFSKQKDALRPDEATLSGSSLTDSDVFEHNKTESVNFDTSLGEKEFDAYMRGVRPVTPEEMQQYEELSMEGNPITGAVKFVADATETFRAKLAHQSPLLWSDKLPDDMYQKAVNDPEAFHADYRRLVKDLNESDFMRGIANEWGFNSLADNTEVQHKDGDMIDGIQEGLGSLVGMVSRDLLVATLMKKATGMRYGADANPLTTASSFELAMALDAGIQEGEANTQLVKILTLR